MTYGAVIDHASYVPGRTRYDCTACGYTHQGDRDSVRTSAAEHRATPRHRTARQRAAARWFRYRLARRG